MTEIDVYLAELVRAQLEGRKPEPIPEGVDVDSLYNIALKNHMTYLILGGLLKTDNLPQTFLNLFREKVMKSILITMNQVGELKQLESCFEESKIINQPLKGSRMKFIYPSPEMREMGDIDVLIRTEDMKNVEKELKEMGYTLNQSIKHHDIYIKKPFMVLEVHRAMYDKTVDKNQYEYFSDLSRVVLRDGKKYTYDFNTEDFYIYMIAHMAKHFYTRGCGIRNLVDIYVYLGKYQNTINRQYVENELNKLGLLTFTRQCERLVEYWMEKKNGDAFLDNLFEYMSNSGIYGKDENGIWHKFSEESSEKKTITRKQLKRWYSFPSLQYMSEYYPWLEKAPVLLPIAWGIRAFRGTFLGKGTQKRKMMRNIQTDDIMKYREIYRNMGLHFK